MKTTLRLIIAAFVLATFNLSAATLYVWQSSPNPSPPFTNWATAATNIQDAVDAATAGDTVLVTNGIYAVGARDVSVLDTNLQPPQMVSAGLSRVVVTNSITLESVNGPLLTTIQGGQILDQNGWATNGIRCVFLANNAIFTGFTLTNGYAYEYRGGGGVYCSSKKVVVTNCTVLGNSAQGNGGGALNGTLYNCTFASNSASWGGGGAVWNCTLYDCMLTANSAYFGGGAYECNLNNCTVTGNWAFAGGGTSGSTLYNCVLTSNSVSGMPELGGPVGGGALGGTLYNCRLISNWSGRRGGGASRSILHNCMLAGNWSPVGGGAYESMLYNCTLTDNFGGATGSEYGSPCILYNCTLTGNSPGADGAFFNCTVVDNDGGISGTAFNSIVYYNSGGNFAEGTVLNHCCTSPLPTNGIGNITGPPLFMDFGTDDFRLREGSPCIDGGTNLIGLAIVPFSYYDTNGDLVTTLVPYTYDSTDILGNTRFIDGNGDGIVAWDIGAYEFNSFRPPRFNGRPQLTSDGWKLTVTGATNKWVRLQRSSNLRDWEDCGSCFMGAGGFQQISDPDTSHPMMFYRIMVP